MKSGEIENFTSKQSSNRGLAKGMAGSEIVTRSSLQELEALSR